MCGIQNESLPNHAERLVIGLTSKDNFFRSAENRPRKNDTRTNLQRQNWSHQSTNYPRLI